MVPDPGKGGTPRYLEDLSGHGRWGLEVDGGVDGGAGGHGHALLLHVAHHHLLLHPLPLRFLLRLLLHQLHPQPDARRHGDTRGWRPPACPALRSPWQEDTACHSGETEAQTSPEHPHSPVANPGGSARGWLRGSALLSHSGRSWCHHPAWLSDPPPQLPPYRKQR